MTTSDAYFARDPSLVARGEGQYVDIQGDLHPVEFVPGLEFRPLIGERMLVNFVHYRPHTDAPVHAHEEEQVTFVLEGEFEFNLDGEVRMMAPGMAVLVPPGVPHGARTRDSVCVEVDVFSPPRRALVEAARMAEGDGGDIVVPPAGS
jgi:quercetin dioxygenase-like cupin family protein